MRSSLEIISTLTERFLHTLIMSLGPILTWRVHHDELVCHYHYFFENDPSFSSRFVEGIFVGGNKVIHFTLVEISSTSNTEVESETEECPTFHDCGFRQPNSGVVLSCLDCFLRNGSLYCFEYGVSPSVLISNIRGGTCSIDASDPDEMVIHRAMHLLQNGFGNYNVFQNNCEYFALYCKTGLLTMDQLGVGRSGQASCIIGAPFAAIPSSPLKLLLPSPVGVTTVTAGVYCVNRYATDIGVRTDVVKVNVEDLAENLGRGLLKK